jgi:hypothetical protein
MQRYISMFIKPSVPKLHPKIRKIVSDYKEEDTANCTDTRSLVQLVQLISPNCYGFWVLNA